MPEKDHHYAVTVTWTGNLGPGTTSYSAFTRAHTIEAPTKPTIPGSSDPAFRGDAARWNPEELLLAALSACHKLWYLHLCAEAGIVVTAYTDHAEGTMHEQKNGAGQFTSVTLRPKITITAASDELKAEDLHHKAHENCFIARSVNFEVNVEAEIQKA